MHATNPNLGSKPDPQEVVHDEPSHATKNGSWSRFRLSNRTSKPPKMLEKNLVRGQKMVISSILHHSSILAQGAVQCHHPLGMKISSPGRCTAHSSS